MRESHFSTSVYMPPLPVRFPGCGVHGEGYEASWLVRSSVQSTISAGDIALVAVTRERESYGPGERPGIYGIADVVSDPYFASAPSGESAYIVDIRYRRIFDHPIDLDTLRGYPVPCGMELFATPETKATFVTLPVTLEQWEVLEPLLDYGVIDKAPTPDRSNPQTLIVGAARRRARGANGLAESDPPTHATLDRAIREAPPYARILVRPGTYKRAVVVDKPLEIIGDGQREDIVIKSSYAPALSISAPEGLVRGLTFRMDGRVLAIQIPRGYVRIEDCNFRSRKGIAISVRGMTTFVSIRRCTFDTPRDDAVELSRWARAILTDCTFPAR